MASDVRAVFDTNVVVSALLLPDSTPRRALDLAFQSGALLISESTIRELDEVLRRPRFNKFISEEERIEFLTALVQVAEMSVVVDKLAVCRDPKDNKFLDLAVAGKATHIVTGDADLLVLHPFRDIEILSPSNFVAQNDR